MGAAAVPAMIALTAASTAFAVHSQRQAAGAQQVELNLAARGEAAAARDREVQRKRRLVAILGSQSAAAAAAGTQMSGSVANISIEDAKRASEESFIDDVNTQGQVSALRRRSTTIGRLSNVRAGASILGAGASIAGAYAGGGRGPETNPALTGTGQ